MPDTRPSLIKTRAGHLYGPHPHTFFSLHACVHRSGQAGVWVCVCCKLGFLLATGMYKCTIHASQRQSVSAQRRNPDAQNKSFCSLVPFGLRLTLSHVCYKPLVNKLDLTADYASRDYVMERGEPFLKNGAKLWEQWLFWFILFIPDPL